MVAVTPLWHRSGPLHPVPLITRGRETDRPPLLHIFKNLRKKKEAEIQLATKDEVAAMMEQQKARRKQRLDQQMAIPAAWNLPADDNMN